MTTMEYLDYIFSDFQRYRKFRGGFWYKIEDQITNFTYWDTQIPHKRNLKIIKQEIW